MDIREEIRELDDKFEEVEALIRADKDIVAMPLKRMPSCTGTSMIRRLVVSPTPSLKMDMMRPIETLNLEQARRLDRVKRKGLQLHAA